MCIHFTFSSRQQMDYPPYDGKPSLYDNQQMMRDVSVDTCNIAVATDPDCLGPCEPGSHVVLEGIVWQETSNGEFNDLFILLGLIFV